MSNINGITGTGKYEQQSCIKEASENNSNVNKNRPEKGKQEESLKDRVSLSGDSKDLQLAKESALAAHDNQPSEADRAEKIQLIKQAVDSGNYEVDPDMTAEKIVGQVIDEII